MLRSTYPNRSPRRSRPCALCELGESRIASERTVELVHLRELNVSRRINLCRRYYKHLKEEGFLLSETVYLRPRLFIETTKGASETNNGFPSPLLRKISPSFSFSLMATQEKSSPTRQAGYVPFDPTTSLPGLHTRRDYAVRSVFSRRARVVRTRVPPSPRRPTSGPGPPRLDHERTADVTTVTGGRTQMITDRCHQDLGNRILDNNKITNDDF